MHGMLRFGHDTEIQNPCAFAIQKDDATKSRSRVTNSRPSL